MDCNRIPNKTIKTEQKDYGYIDTLQISMINEPDPREKEDMSNKLKHRESECDYFTASLRPINHLLQIDPNPNRELAEPRWELYKLCITKYHYHFK